MDCAAPGNAGWSNDATDRDGDGWGVDPSRHWNNGLAHRMDAAEHGARVNHSSRGAIKRMRQPKKTNQPITLLFKRGKYKKKHKIFSRIAFRNQLPSTPFCDLKLLVEESKLGG